MKRIAQFAITLSALFSAIACSENINIDLPETSNHITVTSQVGPQVKAGYDESNLPQTFHMEISTPSFSGTMTKSGNSNIYNFPTGTELTWGEANVEDVVIKAITNPTCYDRRTGKMTIPQNQNDNSNSNIKASDLLGATIGDGITIQDDHINVAFKHLMSKLRVVYTKSSSITVNSLTFKNAAVAGYYNYADMDYDYSKSLEIGSITMCHSSSDKTAEAIFFPYSPLTDKLPTIEISITVRGTNKTLSCPVSLKNAAPFVAGKCYAMKIAIEITTANNAEVTIEPWDNDDTQVSGERVLWIGTSIPAGDPANGYGSYPELVGEALNCTIINNSVGGSLVIKQKDAADAENNVIKVGWSYLAAGGLSQTHAEAESLYRPLGMAAGFDEATITAWLDQVKALSYESLIIPYINGEKDKCTTVILDHGFNDMIKLVLEAGGHQEDGGHVWGYNYLMKLKNKVEGFTYEDYLNKLSTNVNLQALGQNFYIVEMSNIIKEIYKVNPNIKIIIGNYFTLDCPYVERVVLPAFPGMHFGNLICYFNEALAGIWDLDIVNVQNYLWISEEEYWNWNGTECILDWNKFCPDGVHPCYNPASVRAIADIYIRELDGVIGSR